MPYYACGTSCFSRHQAFVRPKRTHHGTQSSFSRNPYCPRNAPLRLSRSNLTLSRSRRVKTIPMCLSGRQTLARRRNGTTSLACRQTGREKPGLSQPAPHDLRRSCAKLCHASGENWIRSNSFSHTFPCRQPTLSRLETANSRSRERLYRYPTLATALVPLERVADLIVRVV